MMIIDFIRRILKVYFQDTSILFIRGFEFR
jgi:hypothetical protein